MHPPPPSYKECSCGKIWNSYGIGEGSDLRTATADTYLAREIPRREGVVLASKKPDLRTAHRVLAEADSMAVFEQEFSDWLQTQGSSLEALRHNQDELQIKMDEFLAETGGGQTPDEAFQHLAASYQLADFTNVGPRWTGKTPGGPQGSGVDGLKQVTRYKGVSTPQLREMQRQMMTSQSQVLDPELLRELSFREVFASQLMAAIHDLTSPGPTPSTDGTKTKRTDPGMNAANDWHHRDQAGRWQRGDGHPTKVKTV